MSKSKAALLAEFPQAVRDRHERYLTAGKFLMLKRMPTSIVSALIGFAMPPVALVFLCMGKPLYAIACALVEWSFNGSGDWSAQARWIAEAEERGAKVRE